MTSGSEEGEGRAPTHTSKGWGFEGVVVALCCVYLGIEAAYVLRLPLVMDEFQGASTVADLLERVPYRDFAPYKNLFGHYFQLPALLLGSLPWRALLSVKFEMVAVNVLALAAAAFSLRRHFRPWAVCLGLALLVFMSDFLERSPDLRVDMLTAWPGLFSLILLLNRRWVVAGLLAGLSFLVSQKGVYFCVAGALATLPHVFGDDQRRRFTPGPSLRFCAATLVPIAGYLLFWSLLSDWSTVWGAVFMSPQRIAFQPLYEDLRGVYWSQTLRRNPAFYGFALLALLQLAFARSRSRDLRRDVSLLVYGLAIVGMGAWHKQPWPYFFVLLVPTLFVLNVSLFDRLLGAANQARLSLTTRAVVIAYIVLGIVVPLTRLRVNLERDSGFQRHMVDLASCALEPGDRYLAGVDLLSDADQSLESLRWIDRPQQQYLVSLDEPALQALIDSLAASPTKLVIDNYRMRELPTPLRRYVTTTFTPMWGSLLVYGPHVPAGSQVLRVRFSGLYAVDAQPEVTVLVDGQAIPPSRELLLDEGPHTIESSGAIRLRLRLPSCEAVGDARYRDTQNFFPSVYTY